MFKRTIVMVLSVTGLTLSSTLALAQSGGSSVVPDRGDRIERRLDRRGDRIDRRLDRRGKRINQRLERRQSRRM